MNKTLFERLLNENLAQAFSNRKLIAKAYPFIKSNRIKMKVEMKKVLRQHLRYGLGKDFETYEYLG